MTTDEDIRDVYTRGYEIPDYVSLASVQQAGRRRARTRATMTGLALACVAIAGAGIGQLLLTPSARTPTPGSQTESTSEPSDPAPTSPSGPPGPFVNVQPGSAAPAGAVAYRSCEDGCRLLLDAPQSDPVDVGENIPELQPMIDSGYRTEDATLSFDAQWLGIPDGQGYLVASMHDAGTVARVPDAPEGERWTPVGWTPSSGSLALARTGIEGVTGFAMVDTFDPTGQTAKVHKLENNPLPDWIPVYNGGDSVVMTEQRPPGEIVSTFETQTVFISSDQFSPGEHFATQERPLDFSACLTDGETLVASDGGITAFTPPPPEAPAAGEGDYISFVIAVDAQTFAPTAVLGFDCSRHEINTRSEGAPVPRTTDTTLITVVGSSRTQVILEGAGDSGGGVVFDQAGSVQVILPGQAAY